jgi:hypothetical protein
MGVGWHELGVDSPLLTVWCCLGAPLSLSFPPPPPPPLRAPGFATPGVGTPGLPRGRKGSTSVSKVSRAEIQKARRARLVSILPAMESVLGRLHELGGTKYVHVCGDGVGTQCPSRVLPP